jgi:hypothetical protein
MRGMAIRTIEVRTTLPWRILTEPSGATGSLLMMNGRKKSSAIRVRPVRPAVNTLRREMDPTIVSKR